LPGVILRKPLKDPLLESFLHRFPGLEAVEIDKVVNAAESFTPDTQMIMGESAEVIDGILEYILFSHRILTILRLTTILLQPV
jgi:hypothetical protein